MKRLRPWDAHTAKKFFATMGEAKEAAIAEMVRMMMAKQVAPRHMPIDVIEGENAEALGDRGLTITWT